MLNLNFLLFTWKKFKNYIFYNVIEFFTKVILLFSDTKNQYLYVVIFFLLIPTTDFLIKENEPKMILKISKVH